MKLNRATLLLDIRGMLVDLHDKLLSAAARWGFSRWGLSDLTENRSFWGSGRSRAAGKPVKKVGGEAPYLLKGFPSPPGPPRPPK